MRGLLECLSKLDSVPRFAREAVGMDTLYHATQDHDGALACNAVRRNLPRAWGVTEPRLGGALRTVATVASGNQVIRSATEGGRLGPQLGRVLYYFEMEARPRARPARSRMR